MTEPHIGDVSANGSLQQATATTYVATGNVDMQWNFGTT